MEGDGGDFDASVRMSGDFGGDVDGDDALRSSANGGREREYHTIMVSGNAFTVDVRYQTLKPVGAGSYGLVVSAEDTVTGEMVAIKKISDTFKDLVDAKRIMREIKLLCKLGEHENIISLVDVMVQPPLTYDFKDVYIVCELMECDLDRIVSSSQDLSNEHAQYFVYQLLRGMKYVCVCVCVRARG